MPAAGGRLIDTASSYRDAESVLGNVIAAAGLRDKVFVATKLEEPDEAELKRSLTRLRTAKVDLLQLHNVRDPRQSLPQFKTWKARGLCRYIGITSTSHRAFAAVEGVLEHETPDFVQIDYSLDDRGFYWRASPCASAICPGVISLATLSRLLPALSRADACDAGKRDAARLSNITAST